MFSHRFAEHLTQTASPQGHNSTPSFMPVPIQGQGVDWRQWIYLIAFFESQNQALAERRNRMFEASVN